MSIDILNFSRNELEEDLKTHLGLEPYRAKQIFGWVYKKRSKSFAEMTNISKDVRKELKSRYSISRPKLSSVEKSTDGTRKYLFELEDGSKIESVLIAQEKRYTLCISSQVGCAIGCTFCKTATMGLKRNLTTAEIIGQVLAVKDDVEDIKNIPEFYNIVFMGMGEPLHNVDNVIRAVVLLNDNLGLDFSGRKITVSTSGLIPAIKKFGASDARANLAVSLNATTDDVRTEIMPINRRWPIKDLLEALREYPLRHKKKITIEYVMLAGVNDRKEDLARLPKLLQGIPSKVNLIPYNENADLGFKSPEEEWVVHWQKSLLSKSVSSSIRWSKGPDINAACGQLATESAKKTPKAKKEQEKLHV